MREGLPASERVSGRGEVEVYESGETQLAKIAITTHAEPPKGQRASCIDTERRFPLCSELIDICTLPQLGKREAIMARGLGVLLSKSKRREG